jgi:lysophospholipase L1-like esterase
MRLATRGLTVALLVGVPGGAQAGGPDCGPVQSYRAATQPDAGADWAQLGRYRADDAGLPPATPAAPRVVFLGDSITAGWDLAAALPLGGVVNRGISGQTTPQMLVRFRQDVVNLTPAVVHIMAGTNDLAENTGPTTLAAIEDNLASMVDLARAHHIRVVLAAVPPALDFTWRPGLQPAAKIVALNEWIRSYAGRNSLVYVDYHAALADERQGFKPALSDDGVHPNKGGYEVMGPLARRAIARALHAASDVPGPGREAARRR